MEQTLLIPKIQNRYESLKKSIEDIGVFSRDAVIDPIKLRFLYDYSNIFISPEVVRSKKEVLFSDGVQISDEALADEMYTNLAIYALNRVTPKNYNKLLDRCRERLTGI